MYWITPHARLCSESSDTDEYVMLFCLPSSGFMLHASFTKPFRDEPEVVNVLRNISAVDNYIINGDKATLINPCTLSMVRWKRLKLWPVHTALA